MTKEDLPAVAVFDRVIRMFYRNNPFPGLPPKQFGILGPEFG